MCPLVVSQGGGPGAGSRAELTLPSLREPESQQEGGSITGHGLPLRTSRPRLGPGPSQCPQSFVQARIHTIISILDLKKPFTCKTPTFFFSPFKKLIYFDPSLTPGEVVDTSFYHNKDLLVVTFLIMIHGKLLSAAFLISV